LQGSGLGGGPELGEDQIVGTGDNGGEHAEPICEVSLEGDLVTITVSERFAGDI
jgi:hypothetical protein